VLTIALTLATAVLLLASNFTITNAQEESTTQPAEIVNPITAVAATTTFQSTNDSFRIQVPEGWVIQDLNNTGSASLEEATQGYGILAQLCPEEQQGAVLTNTSASTNRSSSSNTNNCQGAQDIVHIIRYPDLDTRLQAANNVTFDDNMTTDNILSYHLQKLQEVGYRSIQLVNSTDMTLNLTNPQTNETIATVPAKLVEMTYSTNFAPNDIRTGYFISTATNATTPNPGTTKGYSVFYEGNSTNTNTTATTAAEITSTSDNLSSLPLTPVRQIFDSFELLVAPEVAQAVAQSGAAAASLQFFLIVDILQDLPDRTVEQLLDITNESTLTSHLEKLQELISLNSRYNATDLYSSPSGFSKVITYPSGAIGIYYYLSPVYQSPNNETYALLMLKFAGEASSKFAGSTIGYKVKINGTNDFNFEENGTTDTGLDIQIIRGNSLINALNLPGNYSMVIDILNMNNNPVNEQTRPLSVILARQ
jgi:hypothetical protein